MGDIYNGSTVHSGVRGNPAFDTFLLEKGEMGYWEMIGDGVKRITPELSSVMHAAFTKIDQMLGVDGTETRAYIGPFTTTLAQNAARYIVYEGFQLIPGVNVVTQLVSKTMNDMRDKNSNHPANETKQEGVDTTEEETEQEEVDPSKEETKQEDLRKSKKSKSKKRKPRARL